MSATERTEIMNEVRQIDERLENISREIDLSETERDRLASDRTGYLIQLQDAAQPGDDAGGDKS